MSDYPNKEVVDMLMEKIKKHAALSRLRGQFQSHESPKSYLIWSAEAKEIEEDIENSLYMVLESAFDNGHTQGGMDVVPHLVN